MAKKKSKNGILASRFYRIYFIVVGAALLMIVIGLIWLNGVVRDYEIAQPAHAAEEVARLFEEGDYARIYGLDTSAREISGGDEAFYVDSLKALAEGKTLAWREAYSDDANVKKYSVTVDGDKLASFTLVPSGRTTGHGNTLWQLGTITTHVALQGTEAAGDLTVAPYRVSAPSGYAVTVDGRQLTEADALSTGQPLYPADFLPEGVNNPTMVEYAFFSDSAEPAVSATDATGATATVEKTSENTWECPLREDEQFKQQYGDAIIKLATRVAKYTVKDLSKDSILRNVASGSPAETVLKNFSNSWAPSHKTSTVTDAVVTDFHILSDSCFTCHVEFTFTLTSRRENDYVYPTAYTFCVVKRKGTGKLYSLTFN